MLGLGNKIGSQSSVILESFAPNKLSGLNLWMDANDISTINAKLCADLNGTNHSLTSSNAIFNLGDENFSFCGWIKFDTSTNAMTLLAKYGSAGNRNYTLWKDTFANGNTVKFTVSNNGTTLTSIGSTVVTTGQWYFVAGIHDADNNVLKISINAGDFEVLAYSTGVFSGGTSIFSLGSEFSNSTNFLDGQLDSVGFFKRSLSLSEVKSLYNSGNGTYYDNIPALNGQTYTVGQKLDGTTGYFNSDSLLPDLATTTKGTFSCWVKMVSGTPVAVNNIITFGDTNANEFISLNLQTNGKIRISCRRAAAIDFVIDTTSALVPTQTWTLVTVVQDAIQPTIYINGVSVAITEVTNTDKTAWFNKLTGLDNGRIGTLNFNNLGNIAFMSGIIDEVMFYDRDLSAAEVLAIYNSGNGLTYDSLTAGQKTGLVSYYKMNAKEGAPQLDSVVANANNITPFGGIISTAGKVTDTTIADIESNLVEWWELNEKTGTRTGEKGLYDLTDNNSVGFNIGKVIEPIEANEYVFKWIDKSPNLFEFIQDVAASQPQYFASGFGVKSKPYIKFDGVDDYLIKQIANAFSTHFQGVVFIALAPSSSVTYLLSSADNLTTTKFLSFQSRLNLTLYKSAVQTNGSAVGSKVVFGQSGTTVVDTPVQSNVKSTGIANFYEIRRNGVAQTLGGTADPFGAWFGDVPDRDSLSIGALIDSVPKYSNSRIAEIIYYNAALSNNDILKVENYLQSKYGFA